MKRDTEGLRQEEGLGLRIDVSWYWTFERDLLETRSLDHRLGVQRVLISSIDKLRFRLLLVENGEPERWVLMQSQSCGRYPTLAIAPYVSTGRR